MADKMRAPDICVSILWVLSDEAKETVPFVRDPGSEINATTQREKIPQAIKLERRAIGAHQRFDESARQGIVNVNESVTEIADPKFAIHKSQSPRGIEITI
jgi:hypothetical protein